MKLGLILFTFVRDLTRNRVMTRYLRVVSSYDFKWGPDCLMLFLTTVVVIPNRTVFCFLRTIWYEPREVRNIPNWWEPLWSHARGIILLYSIVLDHRPDSWDFRRSGNNRKRRRRGEYRMRDHISRNECLLDILYFRCGYWQSIK